MAFLNDSVPTHWYCFVRKEYLYNLEKHKGAFEPCVVYGLRCVGGRALEFQILAECGGSFLGVPLNALVHKKDAPILETWQSQFWDCFGEDFGCVEFDYLSNCRCKVMLRDGSVKIGEYLFTVDFVGTGFSDDSSQRKNFHIIKLDDGNYCALPNNRILFHDASFTKPGKRPDWKINTHVWSCEKSADWNVPSDDFFYSVNNPKKRDKK